MGTVITSATVSLDGFIAYPDNTPGELFDWYESGEVEVEHKGDFPNFRLTPQSAAYWREFTESIGALVLLDDPTVVIQGDRVTHLKFAVRR